MHIHTSDARGCAAIGRAEGKAELDTGTSEAGVQDVLLGRSIQVSEPWVIRAWVFKFSTSGPATGSRPFIGVMEVKDGKRRPLPVTNWGVVRGIRWPWRQVCP